MEGFQLTAFYLYLLIILRWLQKEAVRRDSRHRPLISHTVSRNLYNKPENQDRKKEKRIQLSTICLLFFGVVVHVTFDDSFSFLCVAVSQQHCTSLSLGCNPVIYLFHTILSDLRCVQYVTLTLSWTSRIILAAILRGRSLDAACKQGCCICFTSPVLNMERCLTPQPGVCF